MEAAARRIAGRYKPQSQATCGESCFTGKSFQFKVVLAGGVTCGPVGGHTREPQVDFRISVLSHTVFS